MSLRISLPVMLAIGVLPAASGTRSFAASASTAAAPKTHTLFMGADLAVEHKGKLQRVDDVIGTTLRIKPDGTQVVEVPYSRDRVIRVNEALKVTTSTIEVANVNVERAYTAGNDPFRKFVQAARVSVALADMQDMTRAQLIRAQDNTAAAEASGDPNLAGVREAEAEATRALDQTNAMAGADLMQTGTQSNRLSVELAQEMFDAIRISFDVKPSRPMMQPYFVLIAQFRERDARPDASRKWVLAKSIDALEAGATRRVDLVHGGFSPGYILENYSLHLYDHGEEFVSNVSKKRVELTADEALDFHIIEYVSAHKGQSLPAALLTAKLTNMLREQLAGQLSETYYVRVGKDGKIGGIYRDAAAKRPLHDPHLDEAIRAIRFQPALQDGRPTEVIAPLKLGELGAM